VTARVQLPEIFVGCWLLMTSLVIW